MDEFRKIVIDFLCHVDEEYFFGIVIDGMGELFVVHGKSLEFRFSLCFVYCYGAVYQWGFEDDFLGYKNPLLIFGKMCILT